MRKHIFLSSVVLSLLFLSVWGAKPVLAATDTFDSTGQTLSQYDPNWAIVGSNGCPYGNALTTLNCYRTDNGKLKYGGDNAANVLTYTTSSSFISQITTVAQSTSPGSGFIVGVTVDSATSNIGYALFLDSDSTGANFVSAGTQKNNASWGSVTLPTPLPTNVPHVIQIYAVPNGTTSVTLYYTVDGSTVMSAYTDSNSPILSGSPGFYDYYGTAFDIISQWTDLAGSPGVCGSNNGANFSSLASGDSNNCSLGTVTSFAGSGPWSWYCNFNGTNSQLCSASATAQCGSNNNGSFNSLTASTSGDCTVGTVTGFTGTGPWSWTCVNGASSSNDCTASLASHTLNYIAGSGGTLSGTTSQAISGANCGTAVTAVPNSGNIFIGWSDGGTANPRTDCNISGNPSVTANFSPPETIYIDPTCTNNGNGTCNGTAPSCVCATTSGGDGPYNKWSSVTTWTPGYTYAQRGGTTFGTSSISYGGNPIGINTNAYETELINITSSGTSASPITLTSYGTGQAILDGAVPISNSSSFWAPANGHDSAPSGAYCTATSTGACTYGFYHPFMEDGAFLPSSQWAYGLTPGSFSFQSSDTELYYPSSGTPADHTLTGLLKAGVALNGNNYIVVNNMAFKHFVIGVLGSDAAHGDNPTLVTNNNITITNNSFRNSMWGTWLEASGGTASAINVSGNTADGVMSTFEFYVNVSTDGFSGITLSNNVLTHASESVSDSGVYSGIQWKQISAEDDEGIGTQNLNNSTISGNQITGGLCRAINMTNMGGLNSNNQVYNNLLSTNEDVLYAPYDGSNFAVSSSTVTGNMIYNNIIEGGLPAGAGWATTYLGGPAPGTVGASNYFINNLVITPSTGTQSAQTALFVFGDDWTVENNELYGADQSYIVGPTGSNYVNTHINNNLYYGSSANGGQWNGNSFSGWQGLGYDSNSIVGNPIMDWEIQTGILGEYGRIVS